MTNRKLTEQDKKEICSWKYDGKYAIYNLPPYEEMKKLEAGFMNPMREKNYRAFLIDDILIGYINLAEKENGIFLGIGVHPDFCGKGYGKKILKDTCQIAEELYPDKLLYLEVRIWNKRAIKCYEQVGFTIDGNTFERTTEIGKGEFYRMVKI